MKTTPEEAKRKLGLFGIPGGSGDAAERIRDILARLLALGAVSVGELQTARDIVGRKEGTGAHAYLFLAAMFVSLDDGNTAFDPDREDNRGGGLLADACRRREDREDAKSAIKELRKDDKVHGKVCGGSRHYLVDGMLIQKKQIPLIKHNLVLAVNYVGGGAFTHVNHFHIVMPVFWEVGKAGMGSDFDKAPLGQKLPVIHYKFSGGGIILLTNFLMFFENLFLFICNYA